VSVPVQRRAARVLTRSDRSATDKAGDTSAQHAVSGYMAFVLFSVAGLACASSLVPLRAARATLTAHGSRALHRLVDVHARPALRRRVDGGRAGAMRARTRGDGILDKAAVHDTVMLMIGRRVYGLESEDVELSAVWMRPMDVVNDRRESVCMTGGSRGRQSANPVHGGSLPQPLRMAAPYDHQVRSHTRVCDSARGGVMRRACGTNAT
jgi:hypothetical protein